MISLVSTGILSALFFSSTFVLNRAMSLQGGHWAWTASLRYGYMLVLLCLWLLVTRQGHVLRGALRLYCRHWLFWTVSGGIGFGLFYSLLSYSASFAPGWVVATTWQATIMATPLVLLLFGRRVPAQGLLYTLLIFAGIVMVTLEQATAVPLRSIVLGTLPVMGAAVAYPLGNQLVWEARLGRSAFIPSITDPVIDHGIGRVLLLVLGSLPFWLVLLLVTAPPPPSAGQLVNTALVALFSGVIATSLFLQARHRAATPYELAAVDATQATEVIFSLLGEVVFLHGASPKLAGTVGIILVLVGLLLYVKPRQPAPRAG